MTPLAILYHQVLKLRYRVDEAERISWESTAKFLGEVNELKSKIETLKEDMEAAAAWEKKLKDQQSLYQGFLEKVEL
jgi:hypothetical protein